MARKYYWRRKKYFRKYYRKNGYLYRNFYNRKISQAKNLNYYVVKINSQTAVFPQGNPNDQQAILGFYFGTVGTWVNPVDRTDFITLLKGNSEYSKYLGIFNEVMLLGCKIHAVPTFRTTTGQTRAWNGVVNVYFNTDPDHSDIEQADPFILPLENTNTKYWKNMNKHWYPSSLTTGQVGTGLVDMGYLYISHTNILTLPSAACPSWNLYITVYLKFRKNRLNQ